MKLIPKDIVDIINAYTVDLEPVKSIAEHYGMTRQGIWKALKREGVETSGRGRIAVSCSACGEEIIRWRFHVRKQTNLFCNDLCYYAFLEAGNGSGPYIQNRQGQRIGRMKVAELFDLKDGHIVHHEDRNALNNMIDNLVVFANQGDHIRHHRGLEVQPVWRGCDREMAHQY